MQIKVIRKDFINELTKFMTKGQLTYKGKDVYQIKEAVVQSTDKLITLIGWNKSMIYAKTTIPAVVTDIVPNLVLGDLELILAKAKKGKSNEITIEIVGTSVYVRDSKQHFDIPFTTRSIETFTKPLDQFAVTKLEGNEVITRPDETTVIKFNPWFSVEESKELSDYATNCIEDGMVADIDLGTEEGKLLIESPNKTNQIGYGSTMDVVAKNKAAFRIIGGMPIFNNIDKALDVYYYTLTSDASETRFWFHNGNTDWFLKVVDKDAPPENPEE